MDISIIIPAYNEEKRIVTTLQSIDSYFKNHSFDYEILVVNDGSTDRTIEVVNNLKIKNLRIIDNKKNMGKGYVVRQGLLAGKGKYRLFTDADNATSIDQLEKLMPYLQNYDIIIASRNLKGAVIPVPQPLHRRILGDVYRFIVKVIVGVRNIQDSQCGFKLFNEKAVTTILPLCRINRWSFDSEILVVAQKLGYKIKEVPVTWVDDKNSKMTFSQMQKSLLELVMIRWNLISGKYDKS